MTAPPPLSVHRSGTGPPVVLLHGGLPADMTWAAQQELAASWTLIAPNRRGFAPSPAAARQDFRADADDLVDLLADLPGGAHLVGYSYGGLGAQLAAERVPEQVRSLTMVEVPMWNATSGDAVVEAFAELSDRFAADPDDAEAERDFFAAIGVDPKILAGLGDDVLQALELGRRLRSPRELEPHFEPIVDAGIPALVLSGDHHPAHERLCDAIATRLGAQRARLPGAGHAVQRAQGFNTTLETFLTAAERVRGDRGVTDER
ncbi:alpha/beta fold hydrolase [Nocardia sp. NPDC052566]|uniref:alpha/beta fold hydrolase n=1 Tax=Nocardia sp. NPDC052566 TaxID=3364330 RepID=UPI0037C95478